MGVQIQSENLEIPENNITIACVLKSGGDFTIDYVKNLKNMISRNVTIPYEFICLTDLSIPEDICKSIRLKNYWKGWWSKIELFAPKITKFRRIFYFEILLH
jgi:hypothetical protein